jgi:hypothetical protein
MEKFSCDTPSLEASADHMGSLDEMFQNCPALGQEGLDFHTSVSVLATLVGSTHFGKVAFP